MPDDKVRSYEAVFKFTPEEIAQRCVELKEMGFDAARLMITGDIRLKTGKTPFQRIQCESI